MTSESGDSDAQYINSLADFSPLPPPKKVAIGEVNGQFKFVDFPNFGKAGDWSGYEGVFERFIENHNVVSKENFSHTHTRKIPLIKTTAKESCLLNTTEVGLKRIWNAWKDSGIVGIVDAIQALGVPKSMLTLIHGIIVSSHMILNGKRTVKTLLFPHLKMSNVDMIEAYAPIRNWSDSWVRAMSWHQRLPHLALASHDDSIKIYINEYPSTVLPSLKAPEQKLVSCIAWHPYVNELILGVETGFIVWTLHPPLNAAFPTSHFTSTTRTSHAPVTSVEYSPNGQKIMTTSTADTSIFIWSLSTDGKVPLYRLSSGGVPRAAWSPSGTMRIFSNTPGKDFRLWEYDRCAMRPISWSTVTSPVEAFAWHPTGDFLCFVSNCIMFGMTMGFTGEHLVYPLFDLAEVLISQIDTGRSVTMGGKVLQIEWDPTGNRLVVLFSQCSAVAVLGLLPGKNSRLVPCDFISGKEGEYPVAIAFQKDFQHGSLLTIAWSSERLQYFPFIFGNFRQTQPTVPMNQACRTFSYPDAEGGHIGATGRK